MADELRNAIDRQADAAVDELKKRLPPPRTDGLINWPEDVFARWHRDALYFIVVMRTPHGSPATFEGHVARMEHAGGGKFNLATPMRQGWNTFMRNASPEECLKQVVRSAVI